MLRAVIVAVFVMEFAGQATSVQSPNAPELATSSGDSSQHLTSDAIQSRLEKLTPSFPAPPTGIIETGFQHSHYLRLAGVDLVQNTLDKALSSSRLDSSRPLTIVGYWVPDSITESKTAVEARFSSNTSRVTMALELSVGPEQGESPWLPGAVYKRSHQVDLRPISREMSGKVALILGILSLSKGEFKTLPLQNIAAELTPLVSSSRISAQRHELLFGGDFRRLNVEFRLGKGATQMIPVPSDIPFEAGSIAVVSAFSFSAISQDKCVCTVSISDAANNLRVWSILSGVDTARSDIDFYPPSKQDHSKPIIVESYDSTYPNASGGPFKKHRYLGVYELPAEFSSLTSLSFRTETPCIYDVFDIVLLPKGAATVSTQAE